MADFNAPQLSDTYISVLSSLKDRDIDLARGLDPATTAPTNVPIDAVRWNSANNRWEKWSGAVWNALTSTYSITVTNATNATNATNLGNRPVWGSGNNWDVVPYVASDGVMEVGQYLDFHNSDAGVTDFDVRLSTGGTATTLYVNGNTILSSGNYSSYAGGIGISNTWSGSPQYFLSNPGTIAGGSNSNLQAYSTSSGSGAYMAFHRNGIYATNFGVDTDNRLKIGGWTNGSVAWPISHGGNISSRENFTSSANWYVANQTDMPDTGTGGAFGCNGDGNLTEYGLDPWGRRSLIWVTRNNDGSSDADGGWNKTITGVKHTSAYMSVVYIKRASSSTNGSFYHGCDSSGNTLNTDGTPNGNPYFWNTGIGSLPQGVWCVSIGYIHAYGDTSTANYGGIYRLDTGEKVAGYTDYRMANNATTQNHRTYLYYSTDPAAELHWWGPGFYAIDGNEPSVKELIGISDTSFNERGALPSNSWNTSFPLGQYGVYNQITETGGPGSSAYPYGTLLNFGNDYYGAFSKAQVYIPHQYGQMWFRAGWDTDWQGWKRVVTAVSNDNRPGVDRIYRRDDNSDYNVQTSWGADVSGYWSLRGYNGDTFHAHCFVSRAGNITDYTINQSLGTGNAVVHAGFTNNGTLSSNGAIYINNDWLYLNTSYGVYWSAYKVGIRSQGTNWVETYFDSSATLCGLRIRGTSSVYTEIYNDDASWSKFWTNSGNGFYFYQNVYIAGYQSIHSGNISSQSVSYASSAGSAPANGGTATWVTGGIYGSTGTSYSNAAQVREANLGGNQGGGGPHNAYQPRLGFHWSGVVASSITMENNGRIAVVNNPGTSYEAFACGTLTVAGSFSNYGYSLNTGNVLYLGAQTESISTSSFRGINYHTDGDMSYYIGKPAGAWTQPLHVAFYTGIQLRAHRDYGGVKMFSDMGSTQCFSVGEGDNHVRVANNLYIGGYIAPRYLGSSAAASTYNVIWHSGNDLYYASGGRGFYINPSISYVYASSFDANDWFRSWNATGWYNQTYAVGIYSNAAGMVRTYNGAAFTAEGLLYGRNGGSGLGQITVTTYAPTSEGASGDLWFVYQA